MRQALAGLDADIAALSSQDFNRISDSLKVLVPFNDATTKLSCVRVESHPFAAHFLSCSGRIGNECEHISGVSKKQLKEKLFNLKSQNISPLSTILDPRF